MTREIQRYFFFHYILLATKGNLGKGNKAHTGCQMHHSVEPGHRVMLTACRAVEVGLGRWVSVRQAENGKNLQVPEEQVWRCQEPGAAKHSEHRDWKAESLLKAALFSSKSLGVRQCWISTLPVIAVSLAWKWGFSEPILPPPWLTLTSFQPSHNFWALDTWCFSRSRMCSLSAGPGITRPVCPFISKGKETINSYGLDLELVRKRKGQKKKKRFKSQGSRNRNRVGYKKKKKKRNRVG